MAGKKILLVEDDVDIRENMAMVLKYEGYEILQAEHGAEALKILNEEKNSLPDVILLDLFMPVMNGREFLDAVDASDKADIKKIPVILITASEQNTREDLEARTAAVVRKPIDLKSFFVLLKKIIQ
ncbi:MAG: response regulator [Rhizobacter sp.]|nr:response regulator [Bacteriovorax sp.]